MASNDRIQGGTYVIIAFPGLNTGLNPQGNGSTLWYSPSVQSIAIKGRPCTCMQASSSLMTILLTFYQGEQSVCAVTCDHVHEIFQQCI